MNRLQIRLLLLLLAVSLLVPFESAMAKKPLALGAVTLPLAGTVVNAAGQAGLFSGTVTISSFARTHGGAIVAVGIARGSVSFADQVVQTGLQSVVLPVSTGFRAAGLAIPPSAQPRLVPVSAAEPTGGFIRVQAQSCGILHLEIGGNAINLLGFMVNLSPITLDLAGDSAGPLGALVCEIVALLGSAADVVGLLNSLLGLVTGLLGGLLGGLGGVGG
jgi:hypothetical protein